MLQVSSFIFNIHIEAKLPDLNSYIGHTSRLTTIPTTPPLRIAINTVPLIPTTIHNSSPPLFPIQWSKLMIWLELLHRKDVRDILSSIFIVTSGCAFLLLLADDEFILSSTNVSNFGMLWVAGLGCGYLSQTVGSPPLLGSLISGILIKNGLGSAFDLPPGFGETIRTIGLCTILLISSVEININAVARAGSASLRLTLLPGLIEAFTCALSSVWIFKMPFALALSLGFILAAVSPAGSYICRCID